MVGARVTGQSVVLNIYIVVIFNFSTSITVLTPNLYLPYPNGRGVVSILTSLKCSLMRVISTYNSRSVPFIIAVATSQLVL